jgi:hypothetical protein
VYIHARYIYQDDLDEFSLCFVPAGECAIYTIACDTGLGQYDHHQFGRGESPCAAKIVWQELPEGEDKEALAHLVEYTNRQDLDGGVYPQGTCVVIDGQDKQEIPQDLRTIGNLTAIIAGMHEMGRTDYQIFTHMWATFEALVHHRRVQIRGQKEYEAAAKGLTSSVVYFECTPQTYAAFTGCAFRAGANAVIYRLVIPGKEGKPEMYGFGLRRANDLSVDLNQLKGWEGLKEGEVWFIHRDGWLACYGDPKNPKHCKSQVDPQKLAEKFEQLLFAAARSTIR